MLLADLEYRLVVVTHGPDVTLSRTLRSFQEHVTPQPTEWTCHADGSQGRKAALDWARGQSDDDVWHDFSASFRQEGFCTAVRKAWELAVLPGPDWVFWLEHDFEFAEEVDLRVMARIVAELPMLAQMSLMRDSVNAREQEAGGLHSLYEDLLWEVESYGQQWLEHQRYFTTNPSLMRRAFMQQNPWAHESECEGKFGLDLIRSGYKFGVMGDGEPWVKHIGERTGKGY